ncbi:MAG: DUF3822 family protein [Bacteroidales bacterium]|nr:DUF3822 family protein [Bacteroidales bacterium]
MKLETAKQNRILSIRLLPDGFSFYTGPNKESQLLTYSSTIRPGDDYLSLLKDAVFENKLTEEEYLSIHIISVGAPFTFLPDELISKEEYSSFFPTLSKGFGQPVYMSNSIQSIGRVLLYFMEEDLYFFLQRNFPEAHFIHQITPLTSFYLHSKEDETKHCDLFVHCEKQQISLFLTSQEGILFANTFAYHSPNDAIYYIMNTFQQFKFDQLTDRILLNGTTEYTSEIRSILQKYVSNVTFREDDKKQPLDITTLS